MSEAERRGGSEGPPPVPRPRTGPPPRVDDLPPHLDPRRPARSPLRTPLPGGPGRDPARAEALPPHLDPRRGGPAGALPPHLDPRRGRPAGGLPPADPQGRGSVPVVVPPDRRRRLARALSWVALGLSVLVFGVAAVGYALFRTYDGNIDRIPGLTRALPGLSKPPPAPDGARNVLLVGSDSRATTGDRFQGRGAAQTSGQRSDTIILAHLYGDSDAAQLVSFPRDSWVTIPAYTDPTTGEVSPERTGKINSAIEQGGPALLMATVEELTGIRVDHYVQIDFAGFEAMVDELGGVEVCLQRAVKESFSGIDLPAGRQVVRGEQALAFVRQRYGLPNGDLDRIRRQQAFLGSLTREVLSSGTLLDPFALNGFLGAATRSVKVDEGLSGSGLTELALRLRSFSAGGVSFTTVPVTDLGASRGGQQVVLLDQRRSAELFDALRRDVEPGSPAAAPAAPAPLTVPPSQVQVRVLNGAGTAGLGRTAAEDLQEAGFEVVGAPGNRGTGATQTVVRHGPERAEAARTLAAAVPGAVVERDDDLAQALEVVVGSSWAGAQRVTAGAAPAAPAPAAPAPAAPAPAPPAAPPLTAEQDGCVA